MSLKYVQTPATQLYASMSGTDTSCVVSPYPVDLDGNKLVFADFGDNPTFTVDPKIAGIEEICYFTDLVDNGNGTGTLNGLTRDLISKSPYTTSGTGRGHGSNATIVFGANPQTFGAIIAYINAIAIAGAPNASTIIQGLLQLSTSAQVNSGTALGSTSAPLAVTPDVLLTSMYGLYIPAAGEKTILTGLYAGLAGTPFPTGRRKAPSGWFMYDGSLISRTAYPLTFAALCPSEIATITIASPAVITATGHGLVAGDRVHFTTTGGLPSGISINTDYYVLAAGLTTNAFEIALSPSGTVINTTGSQSGAHTLYESAFGKGDGSTTFALPDLRGKSVLGLGATNNISLSFEAGAVSAGSDTIAVPESSFPSDGQLIQFTTTGTLPAGLSLSTNYYVLRQSSTSIKVSTSQNGSAVDITDTGSAGGVHTMNYALTARTILGKAIGEETHAISIAELASHSHTYNAPVGAAQSGGSAIAATASSTNTGSTGSSTPHNNMQPSIAMNWMGLAI